MEQVTTWVRTFASMWCNRFACFILGSWTKTVFTNGDILRLHIACDVMQIQARPSIYYAAVNAFGSNGVNTNMYVLDFLICFLCILIINPMLWAGTMGCAPTSTPSSPVSLILLFAEFFGKSHARITFGCCSPVSHARITFGCCSPSFALPFQVDPSQSLNEHALRVLNIPVKKEKNGEEKRTSGRPPGQSAVHEQPLLRFTGVRADVYTKFSGKSHFVVRRVLW